MTVTTPIGAFVPADFIQAFQNVMTTYQERLFTSGDLKACDYSLQVGSGTATHVGSDRIVVPRTSDFVADVELAAGKSLPERDLRYFMVFYASSKIVVLTQQDIEEAGSDWQLDAHIATVPVHLQARYRAMDACVRMTLGRRFVETGVFPTSAYFRPTDVQDLKVAA